MHVPLRHRSVEVLIHRSVEVLIHRSVEVLIHRSVEVVMVNELKASFNVMLLKEVEHRQVLTTAGVTCT